MTEKQHPDRREFLKISLIGFGGVIMLPSCLKDYHPFLFFKKDEASCMAAICEQIIPADENGPGATQAGVIYYIDKQLHEVFEWEQEHYRTGLASIQQVSKNLHGKLFEDLEPEQQTKFLEKMESGTLPRDAWSADITPSSLFSTMIRHSMQGFYGSPRHGGNRNYISYRLMKIDYPYIVGQNRYRNL